MTKRQMKKGRKPLNEEKMNYNKFDEIENMQLRVFNRVIMATNISKDLGKESCQEYLDLFTNKERVQMTIMTGFIQHHGLETAKKNLFSSMELQ